MNEKQTCTKNIADHTGFYFHVCGRPAKRYFINIRGGKTYRCGLHSRGKSRWIDCAKDQRP